MLEGGGQHSWLIHQPHDLITKKFDARKVRVHWCHQGPSIHWCGQQGESQWSESQGCHMWPHVSPREATRERNTQGGGQVWNHFSHDPLSLFTLANSRISHTLSISPHINNLNNNKKSTRWIFHGGCDEHHDGVHPPQPRISKTRPK